MYHPFSPHQRARDGLFGLQAAYRLQRHVPAGHRDFWGRVRIGAAHTCWPWTGGLSQKGYGLFQYMTFTERAHRVAWELTRRCQIPRGMVVMHICDVRACCNPYHLRLGTLRENTLDMYQKGRGHDQRGESSNRAVLTWEQVRTLRATWAAGGVTKEQLAAQLGISRSHVHNILMGRYWREPQAARA